MSELEQQLARYRKAILDKDRAAQLRLLTTYRTAMERLAPLIELVQFDINSMDEPTPVRIFQLERYKILERQLREEMDRLAQETGTLVRGGQADVIQLGFDAARDIAAASAEDPATIAGSFAGVPRDAVLDLVGMLEPDSPTGQLLASFGEVATKAIRDALTSGVILGKNPRVVAQAVRHATGMQASRALLISRTEMLRSYRTAKLTRYAANADLLDGWKWVSAKQRRTCAACLAMDGETFPLSVQFFPSHPACFVAGTLVSGPQATAGMSRWYSGDVIEVQTKRGRRITVTPNHPILTTEGWVAAGLLNEGSNLIGSAIREGDFFGIDGDDDNVPALIEEIAHSLRSAGAVRSIGVPPSPEHFHGDGLGSEIEIVWSDRLLRDARYPAIRQSFTQDSLIRRSMQAAFLSRASGLTTLLKRFDATTRCIVCGLSQPLAFFGAGALHPHQHAFAPIARGDARLNEASSDRRSHDVVLGSERLFGLSREVTIDNLGNWQRAPREVPDRDAAFFQHGGDSTGADHVRPSDLLQRLAGKVAPDRIVRINRVGFEGHVYNLETTEGWYYANGIIAHNCRCTARPVLNDKYAAKRAPLETGDQWLRRQDADTQDAILGKQGGQAFRDGEVELRDFVRTDKDPKWGESRRDGGIAWARKQAERRAVNTIPVMPTDPYENAIASLPDRNEAKIGANYQARTDLAAAAWDELPDGRTLGQRDTYAGKESVTEKSLLRNAVEWYTRPHGERGYHTIRTRLELVAAGLRLQGTGANEAWAIARAIHLSPPMQTPIYRGSFSRSKSKPERLGNVGDTIRLPGTASFTVDKRVADAFRQGTEIGGAEHDPKLPNHETTIVVLPGAKGFRVDSLSIWDQAEVIASGEFEIVAVDVEEGKRKNGRTYEHVTYTIRQTTYWEPPETPPGRFQ